MIPRTLSHFARCEAVAILAACWMMGAAVPGAAAEVAANVDGARISKADQDAGDWLTYGRTYGEQRFSPLKRITAGNAEQLGLAWYADLDTARGQEATPLVIDGVMYVSTAWSLVKAFDAKSGALLWSYDPKVPRELGVRGCCDVVNRGVAAWKGKIYVGTFDGRLVALDARTGKELWSTLTVDPSKPYSITQAPRVIKGRVVIGNGGSEYGVRGYISAYDSETGKLVWRFYTVPGDPARKAEDRKGEDPILVEAAKTWKGEWWKRGGGGTVWESLSYDPELNLIYFGVGNGTEWDHGYRSRSQGDNWFLSSIVAVDADTGRYVWHYQATPGDEWDYDAVQQLMLADLEIDGTQRQVLMQANKNGFFYVLDRKTGQLISAKNFTPVTWARGVDPKTGRPIENGGIRYDETGKPAKMLPGALGAHSWQPMAFNPGTGLVYIPAQEIGMTYEPVKNFQSASMGWNIAVAAINSPDVRGCLVAWDPVRQKEVWRTNYLGPWNGGVLTTAGNLVVQGNAAGYLAAYRADTGAKVWSMSAQTPVIAAPMSYEVDGQQYIAVLAGWGGAYPLLEGKDANKSGNMRNISRVLAFRLGATGALPAVPPDPALTLNSPPTETASANAANGEPLFARFCSVCHGEAAVGGGIVPDLRYSPFVAVDAWYSIVLDGALREGGMAAFKPVLDRSQASSIRDYVLYRAQKDGATAGEKPSRKPDSEHGAVIVAKGSASGAPACAPCHGSTGDSNGNAAFPRVDGQPAHYLAEQLHDFKSKARDSAVMSSIAAALTPDDIADVSAYYAKAQSRFQPPPKGDAALVEKGKSLAESGNATKGVPGCNSCHGAGGTGEAPTIPYLAGQYAPYTALELQRWQQGVRRNSPEAMRLFAGKLDGSEIAALAAFYEQAKGSSAAPRAASTSD